VLGEVTLTSGATASYYVDAKRAILRQPGFGALAPLLFEAVRSTPNLELTRLEYRPDGSLGATVSVDLNYRAKLWNWGKIGPIRGESDEEWPGRPRRRLL